MTFMQSILHIKSFVKWIFLLSILSISNVALADKLTVSTDRQSVEMGDIVTLMIEADFQSKSGQIDLTALEDQFEILNQQQSNQVEIINGSYNSFTRWRVQILPKQIGKLMIPPFEVNGVKSQPYPITVLNAQVSDANRPYFLEANVDKQTVFIQEQVVYTLRFYHKGSLVNGNIRPPKFGDALLEQLKEQSVYGKTINGQQYTVYEWQYAFFPQSSGQLDIPGPSFSGIVHLRGGQKGVRALAKPISITVQPQAVKNTPYWLPASSLKISQQWQNLPDTVHVGDSIRRTITLEVEGLKASQLPEIKTQNGSNFKIYPDTSKQNQSVSAKGVTSIVNISQAIVPTDEGTLQIPDLTITWWNTATGKPETATLKTDPLTIWPASSSIPPVVQGSDSAQNIAQLSEDRKTTDSTSIPPVAETYPYRPQPTDSFWPYVSLAATLFWLITLLMLFITHKKLKKLQAAANQVSNDNKDEAVKLVFNKQWCDLPLNEFYPELLRQLHDDMNIDSIEQIPNEHLKKAIHQLESHLFAGEKLGYKTMQEICDNWAALINKQNQAGQKKEKQELASLYNN